VSAARLKKLGREISACQRCPELIEWCARAGREKRRAHADYNYWAGPVPGFGDPAAPLLILGLAPGAHGANRTGRLFTGDRSGDFLFAGLHRAGFANQAESLEPGDGLELSGAWISAALRCAPPGNKPTREQINTCLPFVERELNAMPNVRVILCLGGIAWNAALKLMAERACPMPRPRPRFGHGVELQLPASATDKGAGLAPPLLIGSYHVSQQNTFTGRMRPEMLDAVLQRCREVCALPPVEITNG
jgi:uracil-DNA glycosylase family 4